VKPGWSKNINGLCIDIEYVNVDSHAIRIGPNELHLSDPKLYATIYNIDGRYSKDRKFYLAFGTPDTIFTTHDSIRSKSMRHTVAPMFARGAILKAQPLIIDTLKQLAQRLQERGLDRPVNGYNLCRIIPPDVVVKYSFGGQANIVSQCGDEFKATILDSFDAVSTTLPGRAYLIGLRRMQELLPEKIALMLSSDLRKVLSFRDLAIERLQEFDRREKDFEEDSLPVLASLDGFDGYSKLTTSLALIGGGSDTAGATLAYALWHLLRNPELARRLVAELDLAFTAADTEFPSLAVLESGLVLSSIVKETHRCAMAAAGRLPRVVPNDGKEPLVVDGKTIPPGSVVGMSTYTMHTSQEIWGPDAREFRPDRWTDPDSHAHASNLTVYSKGARNCVGQTLANAEIYLTLAFLFRNYEMRLVAGPLEWRLIHRITATPNDSFYMQMTLRASS
jgi:cytochrome P450